MKTRIKLLPFLFLIICLSLNSCATITLKVDTNKLIEQQNSGQITLEEVCEFEDQKETQTIKNYVKSVKKGQVIKWKGKSNNKDYKVNIEAIRVIGGTNPFPDEIQEILYVGKWKGKTKRIVKGLPVKATVGGENCIYELEFSVRRGKEIIIDNQVIDPEIEVRGEM